MNVLFYARDAVAAYGDGLLVMDTTAGALAVSLPSPQGFAGETIAVLNIGTNAVTVTTLGTGAKINESTSHVIATQFQAVRFVANGKDGSAARWYVETDAGLAVLVDAMVYKGVIDCSLNPNYPAGNAGDTYKVSVAGKIGGSSGKTVQVGDFVICNTDGTLAGTEAQRGTAWDVIQGNIVNAAGIINTPAGSIVATTVQAAIDELDSEKAAVAEPIAAAHIAETTAAHTASAIANTPAGDIAATDVQAAIDELDAEKAALADIPTAGSLISADADNALVEGTDDKLFVPESGGGLGYLIYTALLTQSGSDAPVATVHLNTLGVTITWARTSTGIYTATASGAVFAADKTIIDVGPLTASGATQLNGSEVARTSTTVITIRTKFQDATEASSNVSDGVLLETKFTIEVHP